MVAYAFVGTFHNRNPNEVSAASSKLTPDHLNEEGQWQQDQGDFPYSDSGTDITLQELVETSN